MRDILLKILPSRIRDFYRQYGNEKTVNPKVNNIIASALIMMFSILGFVILTDLVTVNALKHFDYEIIRVLITFRSQSLTIFMKYATFIGDSIGYFILVSLLFLFFYLKKHWMLGLQVVLVMVFSSGLNFILKQVISRPRPISDRLVNANFFSFPSGHAMSAIVFYGFLSYLSFVLIKQKAIRRIIFLFSVFMILTISASRIYLGVHYPTDILAGYFAGMGWLMFCIIILNAITLRRLRKSGKLQSNNQQDI